MMDFIKDQFEKNNQSINKALKEMMEGLNIRLEKIEEDVKLLREEMEEIKKKNK